MNYPSIAVERPFDAQRMLHHNGEKIHDLDG
jgi:hypothetical protein